MTQRLYFSSHFVMGYNIEKIIPCLFLIIGEMLERGPGAERRFIF